MKPATYISQKFAQDAAREDIPPAMKPVVVRVAREKYRIAMTDKHSGMNMWWPQQEAERRAN